MKFEVTIFQKAAISRGLTSYGAMVADRNAAEFEALYNVIDGVYMDVREFNSIQELVDFQDTAYANRCVADTRIRPENHEAHIHPYKEFVEAFFLGRKQHLNKTNFIETPAKCYSLEELQIWIDNNSVNLPKD